MSKRAMNITKGIALGVITGATVGYVGNRIMSKNPKTVKRRTNDIMNSVSQIMSDISYMLK